jgi:hypothetical protein
MNLRLKLLRVTLEGEDGLQEVEGKDLLEFLRVDRTLIQVTLEGQNRLEEVERENLLQLLRVDRTPTRVTRM